MSNEWNERNKRIIAEFRANGGVVGGDYEGWPPLIVVTTIGAKSGLEREIPLCTVPDGDGFVLIASKGGSPTHPDWYHNLKAHPRVKTEYGTETFMAEAIEVYGDERRRMFDAMVEKMSFFADYERNTTQREIPVIWLKRERSDS